jgi:hypothetical protein
MQGPHHIDEPAVRGIEDPAQPRPFLGQETGVLLVATPVLQVGLGVGDVPVAADDDLAAVGGGPPPEVLQIAEELRHETDLLLLPFGPHFPRGQIQAGDGDAGQIRLDIPPAAVELGGPEPDPHTVGLTPRVKRHPGAPLGPGGRVHDMPPLRRPYALRKLPGLGPHLLEAHHIGRGTGKPFHEALLRGGAQPVHIHGGHSEHPRTIPAHW